jgi:hypothetical protein
LASYLANFFELEERLAASDADSAEILEQAVDQIGSGG